MGADDGALAPPRGQRDEPDIRRSLRVIHLEDEPNDAELVAARLRADGVACDIVTVDSQEGFEAALQQPCDVILADDRLPSFDGASALAIARERAPLVPFIIVSGTLGEEVAVDRLKAGAADYVLKQRLSRLAPAIARALAETDARIRRRAAEAEVRRLNAELEARVQLRTAELAAANTALADRETALRASEARLQAILDHSPSMVSLTDPDGVYLFANRAFEQAYDLRRSQICGFRDADLFAPRLAEIYAANDRRAMQSGKAIRNEEPALHKDQVRVHETSRVPLVGLDGRPYAICCIADDITERKNAESEIQMARIEAERANRAKSEFLSRMSHELRTPLNAVLGFAQLLSAERLADGQRECVQQIAHGGQHLLHLVNEVLDIARIEAGRLSLSPEPVRLSDTIRDVVELVTPLATERGLSVTVETNVLANQAVIADRLRLHQVLLNLLSNAVKYNRPGGRVTLSCLAAPSSGRLRIVVTDTGAGIPRQKLQLLFRPFERLGAERSGVEGAGLGLTLARGLAEAMGGSVGVDSEVDRGSSFWIELAIADLEARAPQSRVPSSFEPTRVLPPARVLYVEDNLSNVRLMAKLLQSRPSITLVHAPDGETGLRLAREQRPDLVLLDLHLPDMPGEEVQRQLWADPELRGVPVAVLSADATPGQRRRALASGASAYLTKPLDLKHALEVIERILAPGQSPQADSTIEVSE